MKTYVVGAYLGAHANRNYNMFSLSNKKTSVLFWMTEKLEFRELDVSPA